jgi:hypothetical protein
MPSETPCSEHGRRLEEVRLNAITWKSTPQVFPLRRGLIHYLFVFLGTAAGDPTEVNWVGDAFKRDGEFIIGSVKGNIGCVFCEVFH